MQRRIFAKHAPAGPSQGAAPSLKLWEEFNTMHLVSNTPRRRPLATATLPVALAIALATSAQAQDTASSQEQATELDAVQVRGVRNSIASAIALSRSAEWFMRRLPSPAARSTR